MLTEQTTIYDVKSCLSVAETTMPQYEGYNGLIGGSSLTSLSKP